MSFENRPSPPELIVSISIQFTKPDVNKSLEGKTFCLFTQCNNGTKV